jgi:hypothetical protein
MSFVLLFSWKISICSFNIQSYVTLVISSLFTEAISLHIQENTSRETEKINLGRRLPWICICYYPYHTALYLLVFLLLHPQSFVSLWSSLPLTHRCSVNTDWIELSRGPPPLRTKQSVSHKELVDPTSFYPAMSHIIWFPLCSPSSLYFRFPQRW